MAEEKRQSPPLAQQDHKTEHLAEQMLLLCRAMLGPETLFFSSPLCSLSFASSSPRFWIRSLVIPLRPDHRPSVYLRVGHSESSDPGEKSLCEGAKSR